MPKIGHYYLRAKGKTLVRFPISSLPASGRNTITKLMKTNPAQFGLPALLPDPAKKPIILEVSEGRFEIYDCEKTYIKYFVAQHGFKNESSAVRDIETMAEGISDDYREKFWVEHLPRFAEIAREQERDLDESFMRLAMVGRFYDVAGKNVTPSYSSISQSVLQKNKYFLFETIGNNPEGFSNLFERKLMQFASMLRYRAKFSCRLLLFAMFELPERTRRLTRLTIIEAKIKKVGDEEQYFYDERVREKRMGGMRSYIANSLRQVEKKVKAEKDYKSRSAEEQADLLFKEQVEFLRKYSHLGLVRIACVYLREFIDRDLSAEHLEEVMFAAAKKNMQLIYDEMSNFSRVLMKYAYLIAQRRAAASQGMPLKEFKCPETLQAALPELHAANRKMRRQEDHLVRKGMAAVHKTPKARFARLRELLLAHQGSFNKISLAETGSGRQAVSADLTARIWASLSAEERISLEASLVRGRTTPPVSLANYLFGVYRNMRISRVALLVSGANARKEYPSFDYDCLFIYEADGKTTRGSTNQQYFKDLYKYIETTVEAIGHNYDSSFSPFGQGPGTLKTLAEYFNKEDLNSYLIARGFPVLAHGAGDRVFSRRAIDETYKFVYHPETVPILLYMRSREYQQSRRMDIDEYTFGQEKLDTNIKYQPGGLRDIAFLYWMFKMQNNNREPSVFKVLEQIKEKYGAEVDKLIESYEFLMNIRIRLDVDIGRNNKTLPEDEEGEKGKKELTRFAWSLGYDSKGFEADLLMHRGRVASITKKLIGSIVDLPKAEALVESKLGRSQVDEGLGTIF